MEIHSKTVIVVCGPTSVGKTVFSIQLAKHFNTQILSADSRQCFKELNIGVAKPTVEELAEVHHYFINSHSVQQEVNAGVYEQYALHSVEEIFKKNNVAVCVGGTGLYIKAFCEGIDSIPQTPADLRQQLTDTYLAKGLDWLQNEVQQKDLAFWKVAEQQNPHRLLRALEVLHTSGRSITTFRTGSEARRPFNIIKIGLELSRDILNERINKRVDGMMLEGLLEEVQSLKPYESFNALQTVGYRELFDHLNGSLTLSQAIDRIKIDTRQYAKRQMTWFKKDTSVKWFNAADLNIESILSNVEV
jgi:tRNA dimethylallyltransferase